MQAARALAKRYRTKLNLRAQLTAASLLVLFLQRELGDLLLSLPISLSLPLSLPTCELSWWVAIVVIIVVVVVAAAARAPLPMAVAKVLELWVEFKDSTWLDLFWLVLSRFGRVCGQFHLMSCLGWANEHSMYSKVYTIHTYGPI